MNKFEDIEGCPTWDSLPKRIRDAMLYEQYLQTGKRDASVFEREIIEGRTHGGFTWCDTEQEGSYWRGILIDGKFSKFDPSKHECLKETIKTSAVKSKTSKLFLVLR